MASSIPAAKTGIRDYLQGRTGLTPTDGVTIRSAAAATLADEQITLGDVNVTQGRPDMSARKAEDATMACWIRKVTPGEDETAVAAARDRVGVLFGLVQQALENDPSALGTVPAPAYSTPGDETWTEYPGDTEGAATRVCELRFSITWTSHGI